MSARTTRRGLLAGASIAVAGGATAALAVPSSPAVLTADDAKLVELAREFVDGEREQERLEGLAASLPRHSPDRTVLNDRSDVLNERLFAISEEAIRMRAGSLAGQQAKLTLLRHCLPFIQRGIDNPGRWAGVEDRVSDYQHALAWSLVRDMAGGAA